MDNNEFLVVVNARHGMQTGGSHSNVLFVEAKRTVEATYPTYCACYTQFRGALILREDMMNSFILENALQN